MKTLKKTDEATLQAFIDAKAKESEAKKELEKLKPLVTTILKNNAGEAVVGGNRKITITSVAALTPADLKNVWNTVQKLDESTRKAILELNSKGIKTLKEAGIISDSVFKKLMLPTSANDRINVSVIKEKVES